MSTTQILTASDGDDLNILAARFQDALVRAGDLAFLPKERRFVLVANRFMWERPAEGWLAKRYFRSRSGLHFNAVRDVKVQGLKTGKPEAMLSLLTIEAEPMTPDDPEALEHQVTLVFSGGVAVRLQVECLDVEARDVGTPWPTPHRPEHPDQTT